jgi:hypothetical protein
LHQVGVSFDLTILALLHNKNKVPLSIFLLRTLRGAILWQYKRV